MTDPVTVRLAGPDDVALLAALRRQYAEEDQGPSPEPVADRG